MKLLLVARANDGRLPVIEEPHVMVAPGELVHLELPAALTKAVVKREFRGGSSGVGFRVARGMSVRTGAMRGRSVVVGTSIENVDQGILAITSQRTLFSGSRKTIECKHSKLVGLQVYTDGNRDRGVEPTERLHISTRRRAIRGGDHQRCCPIAGLRSHVARGHALCD